MNRLEGKLVRILYKRIQPIMNSDLWNNASKIHNINSIGKRTDVNILANLLAEGVIDINDVNRCGKEAWKIERTNVIQSLACVMLGAVGYGQRHVGTETNKVAIQKLVADEAGTKKALNLKGWVTGHEKGKKFMLFIAISTGGDGFYFNGDDKCNYFIWDFEKCDYKTVNRGF